MKPHILNRRQVREVDRRAVQQYGMSGLVLMENAGRGVVDVLCHLGVNGPIVLACGKGNNAGDGFVIARHLDIRSLDVRVLLWIDPEQFTGDARANFEILKQTDVPIQRMDAANAHRQIDAVLSRADWIVDALLGTGARGEPRSPFDVAIDRLNLASARRLAVDVPSGFDCDTGMAARHAFRADHTCTFVASKPGFDMAGAERFTGQIHVLDIGVPAKLIDEVVAEVF